MHSSALRRILVIGWCEGQPGSYDLAGNHSSVADTVELP
jgi:hypothetical protein